MKLNNLPLNKEIETTKVLKKAISTNKALANLNGVARIIPNSAILINSLVLQEAKDSSAIENIITTHDELYRANLDIESVTNEAKEVQNYKEALLRGFALVKDTKLLLKNFAVTPSIIIKKEICEYFDETMTHTEDHELWLRLALKLEVYYLNLPLTTLGRPQLSQGGLSSNKWAMRKGELKMYKNIIRYKKSLTLLYPFLVIFSLAKHLRHIIKDYFAKNQHR